MNNSFKDLARRLGTERQRLLQELQSEELACTGEREGSPFGKRDDSAAESSELEKHLISIQRIRGQLAEVEHALEKLAQGTYGQCESCGQPIPLNRLEAIPQAKFCLDCKSRQIIRASSNSLPTIQTRKANPKSRRSAHHKISLKR